MSDIKHLSELESNHSIQKIAELDRIYIKKSYIYVACNDAYTIYGIHKLLNNEEYDPIAIFYIAEYSTKCSRRCGYGDCRQFKLLVSDTSEKQKNETFQKNVFIEFDRPQRCTFCYFKRPEMSVNVKINDINIYVGKIVMPFKYFYCPMAIEAYDVNNKLKYSIKDTFCRCIIFCGGCKCKKTCKEDYFKLYDKNQKELIPIKSKAYDCEKSCLHSIYDKITEFPQGAQTQDKILLIATIIMHDLTYLEMPFEKRRVGYNMN
ncbi:scramblase family protein (macronuclear) [Tetrahymena thermophila SB210]|uniref:Scramblase family protein n=1 Tax=Tetrahymena thermophila (strain SB210) TaxID=312017 RepID=Q23BS2_TETTS|nr:scramblase family protein [Tetrahymena thermophila SB210]EAR94046.1 scramblase family protein [Tetrahymena thermophila SB210]|eukprot:XP_001014291.1 scramblase family protein [Tetrahymena thermophila SB210]